MGPMFAGRERVISGRLADTLASRFGKNIKLLRGVIGLRSIPNDYLYAVFDDVISLCGSRSNNTLPWSPRASRFFVHFFASLHDHHVKMPIFMFRGGCEHKTTFFSFPEI